MALDSFGNVFSWGINQMG